MLKAPKRQLSKRDMDVLRLLVHGQTNDEIAQKLHITDNTVEWHLKELYTKLDVRNRTAAAIYAVREGLVDPSQDPEDYGK